MQSLLKSINWEFIPKSDLSLILNSRAALRLYAVYFYQIWEIKGIDFYLLAVKP